MADMRTVRTEVKRKMGAGEPLTQRELSDVANMVRMSGRMDDRMLYTAAKSYRQQQGADKEPTAEERKAELVEAVQLAHEKAARSGYQDDIVAYVKAKAALAEYGDGGDSDDE